MISILTGGYENMKIATLKCLRCNHKWIPRKTDIVQCPKCKSALWNKKKVAK
jgi:Zn finger protein HypA/HybF involved in hydrogenase expression